MEVTANPSLPWTEAQGGQLTFSPAMTEADILDGKLRITLTNGTLLSARLSDENEYDFYKASDPTNTILTLEMNAAHTTGEISVKQGYAVLNISRV